MPVGECELDLLAFGRAAVDLYAQQVGCRLEDVTSFARYIGGSPTNTTIGLSRLGLRAGLVTRVGADHMGRFVEDELAREGVDRRGVKRDPDRLTGLAILGIRNDQDFPLLFYREDCADMALCPADIDPGLVAAAGAVLVNGTHLSRPNTRQACEAAIAIARANGRRVVLDIDYRPVLWGLAARDEGENRYVADLGVTEQLQGIAAACDLIIGTEEEIRILGGCADVDAAITAIRRISAALIVCKRGADGCTAHTVAGEHLSFPGFAVEVYNVLGAGDAFMAGFLSGWLRDEDLSECCRLGNAAGAMVVSRHGCAPAMPSRTEMDYFLAENGRLPRRLRDNAALEQLHRSTTGRPATADLVALAIDHRYQLEELADAVGAPRDRIAAFKLLAVAAVERVAAGRPGFGILLDDRHGSQALFHADTVPIWIARAIELPRTEALAFDGTHDVAAHILSWPSRHVVKCLVQYHPAAPAALLAHQNAQMLHLATACSALRRELLLEIVASPLGRVDPDTAAEAMRAIYDLGIRPDWWKLEPDTRPETWAGIGRVIQEYDPYCRGVVVLGLAAPFPELKESIAAAAGCAAVRGFAVGRSIFIDAATGWLAGRITDEEALRDMAARFSELSDFWRSCRRGTAPAQGTGG